jgi:hypothetical protein
MGNMGLVILATKEFLLRRDGVLVMCLAYYGVQFL